MTLKFAIASAAVVLTVGIAHGKDILTIDSMRGRRACGDVTSFTVSLFNDKGKLKTNGCGRVTLDNFGTKLYFSRDIDFSKSNPQTFFGTMEEPGHLRLSVDVKDASRNDDRGPLAYSVPYEDERIVPGTPEPEDFDAFWKATMDEVTALPFDLQKREEPQLSNDKWTMYHISFASLGCRIYGWMSIPKGKGPWPLDVEIPGAGDGRWAFVIGGHPSKVKVFFTVHPFEPSLDNEENKRRARENQKALRKSEGVPRYPFGGLGKSREAYYFRAIWAGAARAVREFAKMPEVDRSNVVYHGGSQGGASGWALLALANDVFTSGSLTVPACSDMLGYKLKRRGGWPHAEDEWRNVTPEVRNRQIDAILPYYDGCNFAPRIRCPVRVVAGLSDTTCPPSGIRAAFNRLKTPGCVYIPAYRGTHGSAGSIADREEKERQKTSR